MSKFTDNFKKMTLPVKIADITAILLGLAVIIMSSLSLSGVVYISQSIIQICLSLMLAGLAVINWKPYKGVSIFCITAAVVVLLLTILKVLRI